jgi:hypothetical protein
MLSRTTTRYQERQSSSPPPLPSTLDGLKAQSTFSHSTTANRTLSSSSLPLAQSDPIEYSDMPTITTTESILADVACAILSSIDNDHHPYDMSVENHHSRSRHGTISSYKEGGDGNNCNNELNTVLAKSSTISIYNYSRCHEDDLVEDLSLLSDTPISPELASLCSSPATSVPTSPDFSGEMESITLALSTSLSAPPLPDSSLLIQLPDTWSKHHQLVTSRKEKEKSATTTIDTTFNHEMNNEHGLWNKTVAAATTPAANVVMPDTNNYNINIETVAYKPVLPVATAVVPLPQPIESASSITTATETNIQEKTWSIAKGRFVSKTRSDDDDDSDDDDGRYSGNNGEQEDITTWHDDVPSLSTFWISDALVTPDDTDMANEYLWEEPSSSFYNDNLNDHSLPLSPTEDESSTSPPLQSTTTNTNIYDAFEFEITPGRGDHFIEVPLRVQLGRRLIRRKMTY